MKIDIPIDPQSYKPHTNFPEETGRDNKDSFENILSEKIALIKPQPQSNNDVNYNRSSSIGSDALSFLETPILGATSINNSHHKNFPSQDGDIIKYDTPDAKLAQFSIELEEVVSDIKDIKIDIVLMNVPTSILETLPAQLTPSNDANNIGKISNKNDLAKTLNLNDHIDQNRHLPNKTTQLNGTKVSSNEVRATPSPSQFSEIAAKIFQDETGFRLVLKAGRLTDKERSDLEFRITKLLREFNISSSKLDIFSQKEGSK